MIRLILKAHVRGHFRRVGGKRVYIAAHDDRRGHQAAVPIAHLREPSDDKPASQIDALGQRMRPGVILTPPSHLASKFKPLRVVHTPKSMAPSAFVAFETVTARGKGRDAYHSLETIGQMHRDGWRFKGDVDPLSMPATLIQGPPPVAAATPAVVAAVPGASTPEEIKGIIALDPRRWFDVKQLAIRGAKDAAELLDFMRDYNRENVLMLALDDAGVVKHLALVGVGNADSTPWHAREGLQAAFLAGAKYLICTHNHPSGNNTPSQGDIAMTEQFGKVAKAAGLQLVDHIVVGTDAYSMAENGSAPEALTGYDELKALGAAPLTPGRVAEVDTRYTARPGDARKRLDNPKDMAAYIRESVELKPGKLAVISVDIQRKVTSVAYVEEPGINSRALPDLVKAAALGGAHTVFLAKSAWEGDSLATHTQRRTLESLLERYREAEVPMPVADILSFKGDQWWSMQQDGIIKGNGATPKLHLILKAGKPKIPKAPKPEEPGADHDYGHEFRKTTKGLDGRVLHWYQDPKTGHYRSSSVPPADKGPRPKPAAKPKEEKLTQHIVECGKSGLGYVVRCRPEDLELLKNNIREQEEAEE